MTGLWSEFDEYELYVEPDSLPPLTTSTNATEHRGRVLFAGRDHDEQNGGGGGGRSGRSSGNNGGCKWGWAGYDDVGGSGHRKEGKREEWHDPWPTNDDWMLFRRRWVRAMITACSPAAAERGTPSSGPYDSTQMPRWKLKGASLLWRYTQDV